MLELAGVRLRLGRMQFAFDLAVPNGEWVAIIGPSGAGKSTLLNLIAGFVRPESGQIRFEGRDITGLAPARRPVSTLFQEHNLFAHLTIAENVGLGLDPGLRLDAAARLSLAQALSAVGMADHAESFPGTLSGGERQRAGLARALVRDRPLLALDEPLGQLDPALRRDMLELIAEIRRERRLTILMVIHTPEEAADHVDRFLFLENGRIAEELTPADLHGAALPAAVARYLGLEG